MRLLYTGASSFNALQQDPSMSLGGYISSSIIPNNKLNSLFPDLSIYSVQTKQTDVRAIVLENNDGIDWNQFKIGFRYMDPIRNYKIELALVELSNANPQMMERIMDSSTSPYYANFSEPVITDDENNSIEYGDFVNSKRIGIWIRRTVLSSVQDTGEVSVCQFFKNISSEQDLKNQFKLIFNFNTTTI